MLSLDTSATSNDLQKYLIDVKRRLENMVTGFAYELTLRLVEATPIGDANIVGANPDDLQGGELNYYSLYANRAEVYPNFAPMQVGYHKSSWMYNETGAFQMLPGDVDNGSEERVLSAAQSNYKLGDTFYIGAKGFPDGDTGDTFLTFEQGRGTQQTPGGIKGPAWTALASAYQADLQRYYNEG